MLFAFDIFSDGEDLRKLPLSMRKASFSLLSSIKLRQLSKTGQT